MKVFTLWSALFFGALMLARAQQSEIKACREVSMAFQQSNHIQGSYASQLFMDSLLKTCPTSAAVWREKSVPYLKRGDFAMWYLLISKAVELEPKVYLALRGWCLIKFLHDYERGFEDLSRYDTLVAGSYKVVDDTHIKIWMALAKQGLHEDTEALRLYNQAIESTIAVHGANWVGTYDFLYRGILKLKMKDVHGAIQDFDSQIALYEKLSNAYYYRGLALRELGFFQRACVDFARASDFYKQGFCHNDPYVEMPGEISELDVELSLKKCP